MLFRSQKFITLNLILLFLVSCSSKKTNEILLKEINSGLVQSNLVLNGDSRSTIELFKTKLVDPITKGKAEHYYPKLLKVQNATDELTKYIDTLKLEIEKAVSINHKIKSVNELLIANSKYKEVYKKLRQYREQVLLPDSMLLGQIRGYFVIISTEQDTINNDGFLKQCLTDASPVEATTYLNRLQNNIAIVKMKCMRHYHDNVRAHVDWFQSYSSIVAQSAKVLKVGDELEISGGVGAFSRERLLEFLVDGKQIQTNEKGIANYKFKTSKKPGTYSVPVFIRMLDEDSIEQKLNFTVKYSLVEAIKKH
jgi:hypothetical protein